MRWLVLSLLLSAVGCGEPEQGQRFTVVSISPVTGPLRLAVECSDDPVQLGDVQPLNRDSCEYTTDPEVCQIFMDLPPGTCTVLIEVSDLETGETCTQVEELVIGEGDRTNVDIVLDSCMKGRHDLRAAE